jgi:poly(A)-specific ribonuclease
MDITYATFPQELIGIIQHIADSRFVAFDLEFSGVAARRSAGGSGKLSLQEYYQDLRSAAQIYQILQIGLTIVSEDTDKGKMSSIQLYHSRSRNPSSHQVDGDRHRYRSMLG